MNRVLLVGAGQIGSRHLQALRAVRPALDITVVDPSRESLSTARQRYDSAPPEAAPHRVEYCRDIGAIAPVDIAIVATASNVRRRVVEQLPAAAPVRFMILEKVLFANHIDYGAVSKAIAASGTHAWVNCPRRLWPVYRSLRERLGRRRICYHASGSKFGLMCNAIHFLDHASFLTGCSDFELDTSHLDPTPEPSKRPGFFEFNGSLIGSYKDGSRVHLECVGSGSAPLLMEILADDRRCVIMEKDGLLHESAAGNGWSPVARSFVHPLQSTLTASVVENLLAIGDCGLTGYEESCHLHLQLLQPLAKFIAGTSVKSDLDYPFT